jgi:hypothetical protein
MPLSVGDGVGVVPVGSPTHANDRNRSLPPDAAARLLRLGRDLRPEATGARDFLETAEIVARLDLVITVDTAVAHLAGAIGKPCVVLLADPGEWRWGSGERSPWYPEFTLFRQPEPGNWAVVLDRLERELPDLLAAARAS